MNKEIAMRTLAYLITHYKEHDETIINSEEVQAIEFLQQENKQLKDNWNKLKNCMIDIFNRTQEIYYLDLLETMQELEKGDSYE